MGARLVSIQYMSSVVAFVYTVFKLHSTILVTLTICLHPPLALLIKSPYSYLRYSLKCMRNGYPVTLGVNIRNSHEHISLLLPRRIQ